MEGVPPRAFAAATFDVQDAGSAPIHSSPGLGPMTGAIHNISARHLHDIGVSVPDDRQFLRSWRRQLQECLTQQNARIVRFLLAETSGDLSGAEIVRQCTEVFNKFSKPSWSLATSTRELTLPISGTNAQASIEQELGISPVALRDYMRKAVRLYANTATAMSSAEMRLEEKLKRLEAIVGRVNDLMFLEPVAELEQMAEPTRVYLNSILEKISIDGEYKDLTEHYHRFLILRGLVSIGAFQKHPAPTCTICMTKEVAHAMTPCGHTFCDECSQKQMTSCFICRVQIRDKLRVFFN